MNPITQQDFDFGSAVIANIGFGTWLLVGAKQPGMDDPQTFTFKLGRDRNEICEVKVRQTDSNAYNVEAVVTEKKGSQANHPSVVARYANVPREWLGNVTKEIYEDFG